MLKKYFQLESILNNINPTKEEMIYFINEINDLANIEIKGYINNWLKNSINVMIANIYSKNNYKNEEYNNLDNFPHFISLEDITGEKTIHFKSKIIGKINDEEGVFYYKGRISEDLLVTNNNYYYDVFKTRNDDHVKHSPIHGGVLYVPTMRTSFRTSKPFIIL